MRIAKIIICTGFALALPLWSLAADSKTHTLPDDGKAPVITMDSKGGMLRRQNPQAELQVLADGTVLVGDPYGMGRPVEGKISIDQLQALLHFILDGEKFAAIKPDNLKIHGNVMINDATTTTVTVGADGAENELAASGLDFVVRQAGPLSPAADFQAVCERLTFIKNITILGGNDPVQKTVDAINAQLKTQEPAEPAFTPADLKIVRPEGKTGTIAVFQRKVKNDQGWHLLVATVTQSDNENPSIKIQKGPEQKP